jgi:PAS domain S-box-containing protein
MSIASPPTPDPSPASPDQAVSTNRTGFVNENRHVGSSLGEAQAQSEERYALAMESINEGVYDWNVDTGETYFSPPLRIMLGLSADEMVTSDDWFQRIHPDDLSGYRRTLIAHFKGETGRFEAEYRYRARDGSWRWVRHHGIALRGADGRAYRMVGATGDITEAKQREREIQALGEVGQAISSTLDLQTVLSTIVARATQLAGTDAGVIYEYDEPREVFVPRATEGLAAEIVETMISVPVRKGEGATGRLAEVLEPIQLPDILEAPTESRVRDALVRAGYRGAARGSPRPRGSLDRRPHCDPKGNGRIRAGSD